ncbi:unnamed protein product [Acanthosepion pharaonis]|uniref:Uncharacterized protein n=1 Tax=Acanthosepion pharaonis TaxID=158019 RepID=A0A812B2F8_ACAPH|nr:unnamed protein product [Sepia pharaonis]
MGVSLICSAATQDQCVRSANFTKRAACQPRCAYHRKTQKPATGRRIDANGCQLICIAASREQNASRTTAKRRNRRREDGLTRMDVILICSAASHEQCVPSANFKIAPPVRPAASTTAKDKDRPASRTTAKRRDRQAEDGLTRMDVSLICSASSQDQCVRSVNFTNRAAFKTRCAYHRKKQRPVTRRQIDANGAASQSSAFHQRILQRAPPFRPASRTTAKRRDRQDPLHVTPQHARPVTVRRIDANGCQPRLMNSAFHQRILQRALPFRHVARTTAKRRDWQGEDGVTRKDVSLKCSAATQDQYV